MTGEKASRHAARTSIAHPQVATPDLQPVAVTAGIGTTAAKASQSAQLRRGQVFKLHVTLARNPAGSTHAPGRELLQFTSKAKPTPINSINCLLRIDVPGAGGVGIKDAAASFQLLRAFVRPAVALNGTSIPLKNLRHKAAMPPTNITSVPAAGVTRVEWWPVAASQYPAGSGLVYRRTLSLTMRVGKGAPLGGPLAFNVTAFPTLPPPLDQLHVPVAAVPVRVKMRCGACGVGV